MPFDDYSQNRRFHQDVSVSNYFTTAATTSTIITVRDANHDIFIQKISVFIQTDAAQSLTFQDTEGTPKVVAKVPASPGAASKFLFDFGPTGIALTVGASLTATFSAAGLAGHYEVVAYQKRTVVGAP